MSPLDPDIPPAGEEIHLPGGSLQPVLLTVGLTGVIVGITTWPAVSIAGGVLSIAVIVRWVQDTRRDIDELPLEHHH